MNKSVNSLGANEILELIFIYLTEISSRRAYDEILELLANMGRALTNADRCSVWIVNNDKKKITTKVAHGVESITVPMGSGIVGSAVLSGEKIIINDVYKDKRFNVHVDQQTGYKTKSMLVIPMYHNDDVIGVFQAINRRGEQDYFDKRDIERLMLASTYAAETLVAAKLTKEIEDTQKEVVFTMGAIGESRSKETGNHVKRVAEYSKLLALEYGLPEAEAELLKEASPMHDIGKVAIPDKILNKPGRFTPEERKIMNKHAELGYEMTRHSQRDLLKAASIIAYEHHEKYDGTGYPRGLKGEEIHIYGRITALADVFDALGSDRVYKKAWDDKRILKLFKEERGKHFDPKLVDIFFANLDKFFKIRNNFKDLFKQKSEQKDLKEYERQILVLGAYGNKLKGFATSSFLLNQTNVIDAGNLLDGLNEESIHLEKIWLTHAHLDHISDIAYILDNYYALREKPLTIIGEAQTLKALQNCYLNDQIWPDFSKIKLINSNEMVINYEELSLGKIYTLSKDESLKAFKTDHTVGSCGYIYKKANQAVLITSDVYSLQTMFEELELDKEIKSIVVECSFPSDMEKLAEKSKHLTPKLLFKQLKVLENKDITLYINHIKPIYLEKIIAEIERYRGDWEVNILKDGEILNF